MVLQLPYITLGQIEGAKPKVMQHELDELRAENSQRMAQYRKELHEQFDKDSGLGQSLVRDFHLHDHVHFAIEQRISIALCKNAGSWQGECVPSLLC